MTKLIAILILAASFLSCERKSASDNGKIAFNTISPTFSNASWSSKIEAVVDSFVMTSNCEKCIYEMYVNKVLPHYSLITLKSRSPSLEYMKDKRPLFMSTFKGRSFYIYSGLEDFLSGDNNNIEIKTDTTINTYLVWTIVIDGDRITVQEDGGLPFFPSNHENPYNGSKTRDTVYVK